jgi:hypothetical protein
MKKESTHEFIKAKRDIFLVNMAINDKKQEAQKIDNMLNAMQDALD